LSKTIRTWKSVNPIDHQNSIFLIRLFTCTDEPSTDEDTSDEHAQLLDEMSQTLENLLRQNTPAV
jgi:hypothetical protein